MKINKTKFIAEIGVNHNGSIKIAKRLIDEAVKTGADFVKFQVYKTDLLVAKKTQSAPYQRGKANLDQYNLLKKYEFSYRSHETLFNYCKKKNIPYLASPFDIDSTKFLIKKLKLKKIKIASGEIQSFDILEYISKFNIKVFLSTGGSSLKDVDKAIKILSKNKLKKKNITILHCTSSYPAKFNEINLNALKTLKQKFNTEIGYSDHSKGILISLLASLNGASIIERHITLNKKMKGPDHRSSLEPTELKDLIDQVKNIKIILGSPKKLATKSEKINLKFIRKSIFAKKNIEKGELFSYKNLILKRPQIGMKPDLLKKILRKKSKKKYKAGELINEKK